MLYGVTCNALFSIAGSLALKCSVLLVTSMEVSDEGDFFLAIDRYTQAITLNRNNHVLFSNRSAAYARVGKYAEALEDAKRCHELKPDWPKVCTYWTLLLF